jgi:hypothetical protein
MMSKKPAEDAEQRSSRFTTQRVEDFGGGSKTLSGVAVVVMKREKAKADTTFVPSCIGDREVDRDVLGLAADH